MFNRDKGCRGVQLAATPLPEGFSLGKTRVTVRFWAGGRSWAQPLVCSLFAEFCKLRRFLFSALPVSGSKQYQNIPPHPEPDFTAKC